MIRDDFRMHRAGVLLFRLMLVLVIRAREVNRPYLGADARGERNCANKNQNVFAHRKLGSNSIVAAVPIPGLDDAGDTPAATAQDPRYGSLFVRQDAAEREREGSGAKSIQRTNVRAVDPCRETRAPARYAESR
jgi:hypothetical protein